MWKFNNALLENDDFIKMIKKEIELAKLTYALPVYHPNFVSNENGESLELLIPVTLFLETLLCQLRGQIIKFSKTLKKKETESERKLMIDIERLNVEIDSGLNHETFKDSLRARTLELENLREKKIKGSIIRSRANLVGNWEKPSKFFLNLEKRNYLNKNIPSLMDENNRIITDSKKILEMQKSFYEKLYTSTDTTPLKYSKYDTNIQNLPTISKVKKIALDNIITIEEVETAIHTSKQNKAPGPDGFSNEFYKFFNSELKFWLFRYYLEAIDRGSLSVSALDGIITCIPKQGKLRNDLKNWRPLTFLNSVYKFYSSIIAKRLKDTLPSIINEDQTGFIAGRFIGENTRMIYDVIDYCETFNERGILIILDFSKAFDTIEWPFIEETLKRFNFGETFIELIKLCQVNSKSRVEQNGHLSSYISLTRGCRQGDPLSPYVFVLCAEILSHVLRESGKVRGLVVYDRECRVSQYADDTTLLLQEDYDSVVEVLRILKWFKCVSGLDINKEKTHVVKIGASRGSSIPWQGKFGFKWSTTFEILGIYYDVNRMSEITDLNINRKLGEIKKLSRVWQSRNLTPYGKVTIIKSLLLSKITHMLLSLPSPNFFSIKELNNTFSNFLWCGKPPKWRKEILEGEICYGGLKLHNIVLFDKTLKLGWLKRFLKSNSKWTRVPKEFDLEQCFVYGPDFIDRIMEMTSNRFWLDVLGSLKFLWESNSLQHKDSILNTPLWFNPELRFQLRRDWLNKGITMISDILSNNNVVMSNDDLRETYSIKINFIDYHNFKSTITDYLSWKEKSTKQESFPKNSALNKLLNIDTKGCSKLYKLLKGTNTHIIDNISDIWEQKCEIHLATFEICTSFNLHHACYSDTYLKYIQFRTIHKRFYTNDKLFKMGIKKSPNCSLCSIEVDSVEHMLFDCPVSRDLWLSVQNLIVELGIPNYIITKEKIIMGEMERVLCINSIILLTKKILYNCMKEAKIPHALMVKNETKNFYYQEKYRLYMKGKRSEFDKKYSLLQTVYENT